MLCAECLADYVDQEKTMADVCKAVTIAFGGSALCQDHFEQGYARVKAEAEVDL